MRVLEGRRGLLYVEGVTLCLSSQERGILCGGKGEGKGEGGAEVKGVDLDLGRSCVRCLLLEKRVKDTIIKPV